jgi:hypothetical protein
MSTAERRVGLTMDLGAIPVASWQDLSVCDVLFRCAVALIAGGQPSLRSPSLSESRTTCQRPPSRRGPSTV